MKVAKDTLIPPSSKGGIKSADCLSSIHVPVEQEIVGNMTLSQPDSSVSSIAHSSSDVAEVRLEEVDSNAVTAMLWPSDSMLRQSLLSPALLSFTYPGHDKPVKDIDLDMKGVTTCNSGLVQVLSLSPGESTKSTMCQTTDSLTTTQDLRTPMLNHSSNSGAQFYSPSNTNSPEEIVSKKRKRGSDHQDSDAGLPLPPITELTSSHMLAAVNELNLQRLQRSISGKHKVEHETNVIDHDSASPSRSCVFSSHSDCSPLTQRHHASQAILPSDLMLVTSDSNDIHHDHLHNHDENLADDSPSNSGLLSHLPPREAALPAISGSQVSSVLSALAEGVSVDSTSASEDVDMEQEERPHSTHLCVAVSSQIRRDSLPVFSQLKDSSNSSQCSDSSKIQERETDQILSPINQSSRSDSLSLHCVKREPLPVLMSQVSAGTSSHSVDENTSDIPIDDLLPSSSKHTRSNLKEFVKPEINSFIIASKLNNNRSLNDGCLTGRKRHCVNHKKSGCESDKSPTLVHHPLKQNRQRKKYTGQVKIYQQQSKSTTEDPVIKPLREDTTESNLVEEVACFKCKFCPFLSLDKSGVTNHIEEHHSTEISSKCGNTFADSTSDRAGPRDWSNHLKRRRLKCPGCPNVFFSSNALEVHLSQDHQVSDTELKIILKSMDVENSATSTSNKVSSLKEEKLINKNSGESDMKPMDISAEEVMEMVESSPSVKRKGMSKKNGKDTKRLKETSGSHPNVLQAFMDQQGKICLKQVENCSSEDREECDGETEEERSSSALGLVSVETALEVSEEEDDDDDEGKVCSETEKEVGKDVSKKNMCTDPLLVNARPTPKRRGRPRGSRNTGITALRRMNPSVRLGEKELGYRCGIDGCAVRMRSLDNIEYHRKCHVAGGGSDNGGMQHVCPECGELFSHWRSVGVHLWRAHVIDMELYSCDQCTYKTNSYSKLMNLHKRIHSSERPFLCDACGKGFKTSKQLRNHKTIHLVKLKQRIMHCGECEVCHRSFSDRRMLRLHRDTVHHKLRPYLCNFCGYAASSRSTLKMHMRQHTGEKPFQCDACDYRTADHNTLRRHKMRHSGEKPYKCPYCTYACIQSSTYKTHLKNKHPGQDDGLMFSCHLCSFRSIKRENYVTHMADHEHGAIPAVGNNGIKRAHRTNGETSDGSNNEKVFTFPVISRSKKKNEKSSGKNNSQSNSRKTSKLSNKLELQKDSGLVNMEGSLTELCGHDSEASGLPVESDLDPLRSQEVIDEGPIILSVHSGPSMEDSKEIIIPDRIPHLSHTGDNLNEQQQNHFMYSSSLEGILQQMPLQHLSNVVVSPWQTYLSGPGHSRNSSCENGLDEKDGDVSLEAESALSSNGETMHSSQMHSSQSILFPTNGATSLTTNISASYPISTTNSSSSSSSCSEGLHFTSQQQMMKLAMGQIQQGSVIRVVEHLCSSPSPVVTTDAVTLTSAGLLRPPTHVESITIAHMSMTQDDENTSDQIRGDVLVTTEVCDDEEELKYKVTKELREIS